MTDSFQNGDQINYKLWAEFNDSVAANNYFELTETINDTACCKTEKTVYVPGKYYPVYKTITYRLNFMSGAPTKRALISDTLDAARFDLKSLRILSNNGNPTTYINNNVLYVAYNEINTMNKAEFVYSLDLKVPVSDSFTTNNKAYCNFYYQSLKTNNVSTSIVSPIIYDTLSKKSYCSHETLDLGFKAFYQPEQGNHFKVYISDSLGNFSQQSLLLDTLCTARNNVLSFRLPVVYQQNSFKIKIAGSNPAIEAFSYVKNPSLILQPLPGTKFNTNLNNGNLCLNDNLVLKAFGAQTYQFLKNGNATDGFNQDSVYSEKINANGAYLIKFKSTLGCISSSPVINVNVLPLPNVKLNVTDNTICDGELAEIKFSGASTYALCRNNNSLIDSNIISSPYKFIPPLNLSYYTLIGKDNNGCKDTSNQIFVLVNPLPAKPIISRVNKALKSSYGFNNQWYNLNGKIDTAVNQYFYPPSDTKYFVKHTDNNGCVSTSDLYDVTYTMIHSIRKQTFFTIYPNPSSHQFSIENLSALSYTFDLYDAFGRIILNNASESKINTINVDDLTSGNYYLRISTSGDIYNFKLVILN